MSNQNRKSTYEIVLDFTEKEVNKLRDEIAYLLENPATEEEDIERIERNLKKCFIVSYSYCYVILA